MGIGLNVGRIRELLAGFHDSDSVVVEISIYNPLRDERVLDNYAITGIRPATSGARVRIETEQD